MIAREASNLTIASVRHSETSRGVAAPTRDEKDRHPERVFEKFGKAEIRHPEPYSAKDLASQFKARSFAEYGSG